MKKWANPSILELSLKKTYSISDYITTCNWNGIVAYGNDNGNSNEEYTDPNTKPVNHPDWVWCNLHLRWHPKDHSES